MFEGILKVDSVCMHVLLLSFFGPCIASPNKVCDVILLYCSLAELPEYQIKIASNDVVMQQMFSTAFSPSSDFVSSYMAVGTLDFLSKQ